jgi:surface protein
MSGTFLDASNFNQPLNSWDVSQVINMRQTFNDASSFNQPLDNWDVSQVTNMIGMFGDTNSFNQPLDNWDVSKVTNMYAMFREATSFNQPLDNWDVSQVTNMYRMFYYATSFNQPLNNWDVSQVTSMRSMFSVTFLFNQPLDNWNVSNVTNMGSMFRSSISFNQPLDNWDVSQVTSMDFMFESASSFNQDLSEWCVEQIPVEPQNFAANSTLQNNFFPNWGADCKNTNPDFNIAPNGVTCLCPEADFGDTGTLTINGETKIFTKRSRAQLDVLIGNNDQDPQIAQTCSTGIADMSSLFLNKSSFNQNISSWDVSNVTSMQSMFEVASSFNQPLDDWDVSQVIDMSFMFGGALVFNQDLSGWCVEQIPDEPFEFAVNSALQIDFFPNWGAECENTNPDFYLAPNGVSCLCPEADFGDTGTFTINGEAKTLTKRTEAELRDLAIIDIDDPQIALTCTSGITNMNDLFNLFNGIIFSFNQNLEHWDVSQVTDMTNMFVYASSFNQALNSWDVSQVTSMQQMFAAASAFDQPLDNWDVSNVTNMRSIFSGASSFNQPLDNWDVSNVTNMRSIFSGASSFNQLLGSWDVSQVTTMTFMFSDASSFNQPLDNWDLSKVTDMQGMFRNATTFDRDLSDWSFNQEVYLDQFLSDSGMSSDNYDTLLQSFDNQNLINLTMGADNIAYCDEQTRSNLIDNKGWTIIGDILGQCGDVLNPSTTPFVTTWTVEDDLSVAIYTLNAFNYDFAVDWGDGEIDQNVTADITHNYASPGTYTVSIIGVFPYFKTCEIATNSSVCDNAPKLSSIESWGDQEWRTMNGSFRSANFNINTAQTPDLSNVTSMYRTFYRATDFNQNINNWDVSQINVMTETFRDASNFNQPLNSWDVSQVSDMGGMFYRANSFNQPLESWDVSSVINMSKMFFLASSFNQDLSGWCVEQIPSEPEDFAVNSALQDDFFPNWGAECNLSTTNTDAIGFNILIYPNPSNSKVFIENDGQIILSKIKLMDMLGRDIKIFSASQITNGLDVSGVDAGNYFVQFTTVDDRQFVKRLIVK